MIYLHITIICIISTVQIQSDATLQRTLGTELKITRSIESHVEQLATIVNRIERRIDTLLSKWTHIDRADCVSTPLTALVMVLRLVQDWLPFLTTMVGRFSKLNHLPLGKVRWPTIADVEGAARGVMRSQITYDLSTALLVRGVQRDIFLTNVTAAVCFEVARQYFLKERFSEAKEWLQHSLAGIPDSDHAPSRETVLYYLAAALCFSGDAISSINMFRSILKENPLGKIPNDLTDYYIIMGTQGCVYPEERIFRLLDRRHARSDTHISVINFYRNTFAIENHSRLCRGEVKTDSRLTCRYVHYQQPHLRFQPFKLEELQLDPPVVRFYDLVSNQEAESLINQGKTTMEPANVAPNSSVRMTEYRTSHVKWLDSDRTAWLTRRISEATHLGANHANPHQVSRYSVSGEYLPHVDFFGYTLNDVEQGGNTVFTVWEISVPPVRNSAVLWFNYKPNGETDFNSQHSGCPVLKGTKWVLNKWIHNDGNYVNFPCTLDKQGSFKGFYL